jgi:hypothetical protein
MTIEYIKYNGLVSFLSHFNKTAFSVVSLNEKSDEKEYWLSKTEEERLQAIEFMRQVMYDYDPSTTRLQIIFTVAQFP